MTTSRTALQEHAAIDPPSTCVACSGAADDPLSVLTWTLEVQDDDHRWICIECSRDHVREIEGRLDLDFWAPAV